MCATLVAHDVYMNRITLFIGYITQRLRRRCLELPQPIASAMMAMFLAVLLTANTTLPACGDNCFIAAEAGWLLAAFICNLQSASTYLCSVLIFLMFRLYFV